MTMAAQPKIVADALVRMRVDSLQRIVSQMPVGHNLRLDALCRLSVIHQYENSGIGYARQVLDEAQLPQTDLYRMRASLSAATYYSSNTQIDSVIYFSRAVLPIAERWNDWDKYFEAYKLLINIYLYTSQWELAIDESQRVFDKALATDYADGIVQAYITGSIAHKALGRAKESRAELEEAYQYLKKSHRTDGYSFGYSFIEVLNLLIPQLIEAKETQLLISRTTELETALTTFFKTPHAMPNTPAYQVPILYSYLNTYYAYINIFLQQSETAYQYLQSARRSIGNQPLAVDSRLFYRAYSDYYDLLRNDYTTAITYMDSAMVVASTFTPYLYYTYMADRAKLSEKYQHYNDALRDYHTSISALDSLNHYTSHAQLEQLLQRFNYAQLEIQNQSLILQQQRVLLIVASILLALLLTFGIRTAYVFHLIRQSTRTAQLATQIARQHNIDKHELLANMSYNIRLPLNAVVGFSQLLAEDKVINETERTAYSYIIQQKSAGLMSLVNDVLDLSRLEAGMMKWQLTDYDLSDLCSETLTQTQCTSADSGIRYAYTPAKGPTPIRTDIARFQQVLHSLITYPVTDVHAPERMIALTLAVNNRQVMIRIEGSPLVDPAWQTQEAILKTEIARLFFRHFKGELRVAQQANNNQLVECTYPLA
jgi:signal transduction histidine kinase